MAIFCLFLYHQGWAQQFLVEHYVNNHKKGTIEVALLEWPAIESEQRPWSRWWWMGNAVDKSNITWNLEKLHEAGIGGVEITPIYGVEGFENNYIDFLSPKWMDMLHYTVKEADRLGMKVDLILGTGWPYGGYWLSNNDAARKVVVQTYSVSEGEQLQNSVESVNRTFASEEPLHTLMAYSSTGKALNLTNKVNERGTLDWIAPANQGDWTLSAFFAGWTTQQVKRAAPGGEGNVLDHFSDVATQNYLQKFDEVFSSSDNGLIRAFFNDSYEVYEADWTYDFFKQFKKYQNYDLRDYLPSFMGMEPQIPVRKR